jgi:cytochrome c oxidase assembly protein subunit 11
MNRNTILAASLAALPLGMLGVSYAAVPLYDLFCEVTGYGGTTRRADKAADRTLDREVVVRFDANVLGLPWSFAPEVAQTRVRLGETTLVTFVAENHSTKRTVGTATFNVQPDASGSYFNKIECFCFTEQALAPGERIEMPVQFFVSPDFADDRHMQAVRTITLSYTFFPVPGAGQPVAQAPGDGSDKKL